MVGRRVVRVYHRLQSSSQTAADALKQQISGEIWGLAPRGSDIPAVQAYIGPIPANVRGIEFTKDVPPDSGTPPGQAYWRGPRPGVVVEDDFAKIACTVTKNTQT